MQDKDTTLIELERRTIKDPNIFCWLYIGGQSHGYGVYNGIGVHRLSCWIFYDLDLGNSYEQANHEPTCNNRSCWNPAHLYVGNASKNTIDVMMLQGLHGAAAFQKNKTHCKNGHEFTPANTKAENGGRRCKACAKLSKQKYRRNKLYT